jgi:hypothetical protein
VCPPNRAIFFDCAWSREGRGDAFPRPHRPRGSLSQRTRLDRVSWAVQALASRGRSGSAVALPLKVAGLSIRAAARHWRTSSARGACARPVMISSGSIPCRLSCPGVPWRIGVRAKQPKQTHPTG